MEFKLTTDMTALPKEIGFNFAELKTALAESLTHYRGLLVTEDTIKDAKNDRANLNKLRTAIDTRRKEIKRDYLQPYTAFEAKCKELMLLIDEPIKAIDDQLAAFEDKRKQEKLELVKEAYLACISGSFREFIPLKRIFDQRWLNAGTTMKKVEEDLTAWNERINADMLALDSIEEEYRTAVRQKYVETLSVSAAITHRDALRAAEAAFKAREAERIALKEKEATEAARAAQIPPEPTPAPAAQEAPAEKLNTLRLEFQITRAQAFALKDFLDASGIKYTKIN